MDVWDINYAWCCPLSFSDQLAKQKVGWDNSTTWNRLLIHKSTYPSNYPRKCMYTKPNHQNKLTKEPLRGQNCYFCFNTDHCYTDRTRPESAFIQNFLGMRELQKSLATQAVWWCARRTKPNPSASCFSLAQFLHDCGCTTFNSE